MAAQCANRQYKPIAKPRVRDTGYTAKPKIDAKMAFELWKQYYSDVEIALEIGVTNYGIRSWRRRNNLPTVVDNHGNIITRDCDYELIEVARGQYRAVKVDRLEA